MLPLKGGKESQVTWNGFFAASTANPITFDVKVDY